MVNRRALSKLFVCEQSIDAGRGSSVPQLSFCRLRYYGYWKHFLYLLWTQDCCCPTRPRATPTCGVDFQSAILNVTCISEEKSHCV